MKWPFNWHDGGLLRGKQRQAQHNKVQEIAKPIQEDTIIQDIFNVIIELRINADNLEDVLNRLKEEENVNGRDYG